MILTRHALFQESPYVALQYSVVIHGPFEEKRLEVELEYPFRDVSRIPILDLVL